MYGYNIIIISKYFRKNLEIETKDCSKFFVYGADLGSLVKLIKFGTDPTND